jgi:hypothetical protein
MEVIMKKILCITCFIGCCVFSLGAMEIENSAKGVAAFTSELQTLRNGELKGKVLDIISKIGQETDDAFKVTVLDAASRIVGDPLPGVNSRLLDEIKKITNDQDLDEEKYGLKLWEWLYDNNKGAFRAEKYSIDVIRSMISKLCDTKKFNNEIKPILIGNGLQYYIPQPQITEQFVWPQK